LTAVHYIYGQDRDWFWLLQITITRAQSSARLPRSDVQDEQRIPEFVCDLHAPVVAGLQLAVETLERLPCHHGGLFPSGMLVRKLLALLIDERRVVVNIEKVSRHNM
jgi:hypothetical protein